MPASAPAIDCDLLVVGGGINGAGIARDAAGLSEVSNRVFMRRPLNVKRGA
jgi:hypothetical protein